MNSNDPIVSILLAVTVLVLLIYRQMRPRRLSERGLWLMPVIILYFIVQSWPKFHLTPTKFTEIGISAVVSIVFGLLACQQLKVYASPKTGKAIASGSWTYFLWWLAAFVIKGALSVAFGETSFGKISEAEILVPVFFLVVTRNAYLYWRVNQLGLELHTHHD
jgi:hypothetical protein